MILITLLSFIGFLCSLIIFIITKNSTLESVTITLAVIFYHFAMRLAVGYTVNSIMKNKANHNNFWFREKPFEKKFYKLIRVRAWKKLLPTFSPETFNFSLNSISEIIGATCQAEIVHEIIMLFSLLPIGLIPFLDGAIALIITSVLAMLIDLLFVILQRYNRPKLIKVLNGLSKLKKD